MVTHLVHGFSDLNRVGNGRFSILVNLLLLDDDDDEEDDDIDDKDDDDDHDEDVEAKTSLRSQAL